MSNLWTVIDESTRCAAGVLWTPDLSLDLWGNDWALIDTPIRFGIRAGTTVADSIYPSTATGVTLSFYFPDDWDLDSSFDTLTASIAIKMDWSSTGGDTTWDFQLRDSTATYTSNTYTTSGTSGTTDLLTLSWPDTAVPTGRQDVQVRITPSGNNGRTLTITKAATSDPDGHLFVTLAATSFGTPATNPSMFVPQSRVISTSAPLSGGGDLSTDLTLSLDTSGLATITTAASAPAVGSADFWYDSANDVLYADMNGAWVHLLTK